MNKILKFIKELKAKGFATSEEKAKLASMLKDVEDAELVEDQVEEANELPEEDPAEKEEEEKALSTIKSYVKGEVDLSVSKMKSELAKEVDAFMEEQKELAQKKAGLQEKSVKEARQKTNEYLRTLSRSILSNDYATVKEMTTGDAGQYIVDSELSAEIRHLMTEYGVARREFFTTQLSKNAYDANALVTDVSVSWVDEGGDIPTSAVTLTQKELKLKKLAVIAVISRELLEDEEVDLFSFIATRVAEGFAKAEDTAFFNGDGTGATGGFTGLLQDADLTQVDFADKDSITAEKIYEMIDTLPSGAHDGAKFYFHRTILSQIRLIQDGNGRYIFQNPLNESGGATLAGYPVVTVEAMPSHSDADLGLMLFGNLAKTSILGYRGGIAVDRTNSAIVRNAGDTADVNTFTTDREAIRWVSRVGAITILPSATVKGVALV